MPTTEAFEAAKRSLNDAQRTAVETVEGPVLVVAGPGTGKTHILTLRIANILAKTDASPDSILVLTFTDSAARTVGKRLAGLVGEEAARRVGVFTFHSFAGEILRRHPEAFPAYTDRRLMGEVEQVLLWRDVLEGAGDTALRTPKSPFHYLNDLKQLEDQLTRERMSTEAYRAWLATEERRLLEDPKLVYARGGKSGAAGELNAAGQKRRERLLKGEEAARLIEAYRALKDERGVYDYTDVLRIVADALTTDEALRAELQEQYQYVLADEHQDANALQHALLDALAFDDHPNLFIVGDEKQAVYGFQGADTTHFATFLERYPRAVVVELEENYRSYQGILDLAHGLLGDLPSATGSHVALRGARGSGGTLALLAAPDPLAERDQVATLVAQAIDEGVPPHEIAVITLKNRTADAFALHLRARGIPTLRAGNVDLDGRPAIRFLFALMHAVADATDTAALRDALLAPWWKEPLAERARVLRTTRDGELEARLAEALPRIAGVLTTLRTQASTVPPLNAFSYLLTDSGARAFFLSGAEQVAEDIPLVRQIMLHLEEIAARDPNATFAELMDAFRKAREHEIGSIKTTLTQREGQVTVITAHKAKGMEFERVFVTALTSREWEGRGKSALLPSPFAAERERAELIRLFYVALTRAKDVLTLSYPAAGSEGKEETPLSLLPPGLLQVAVPHDPLPQLHASVQAPELVRELTLRYLATDGLSPSALNEYLDAPSTFFAKRVLRLSEPETRAIALGNAVHAAIAGDLRLAASSDEERAAAAYAELARSLRRSLLPRGDAFSQLERYARDCVAAYLESAVRTRAPVAVEETFKVERTRKGAAVVLKGKVDAVLAGEQGARIVDFKTSSTIDKANQEQFERQLAFYDLLLRENGHDPAEACIVQVSDEGVVEHPVALNDSTRAELMSTLDTVLGELTSGAWRSGAAPAEERPYDALLDLFKS